MVACAAKVGTTKSGSADYKVRQMGSRGPATTDSSRLGSTTSEIPASRLKRSGNAGTKKSDNVSTAI